MSEPLPAARYNGATRTAHRAGAPIDATMGAPAIRLPSRRRQLASIALYCLVAFSLAWLACLPLWLGPGLSDPGLVGICGGIAMFAPALSAVLIARLVEQRRWRQRGIPLTRASVDGDQTPTEDAVFASLGLRLRGGWRRILGAAVVGMIAPVLLVMAAQLIAGAFGAFALDLTQQQTALDLGLPAGTPLTQLWLIFGGNLLVAMLFGASITTLLALGEELGWRGFLMPRIERLWGRPAAVLVGGVIWGLWHAPLILLGYNYPDAAPWAGQLAMIVACTAVGGVLYLLTVCFDSVWPAAVMHGVNNATSALIMAALLVPGATSDSINGSALGWPGWIVYGTVTVVGFALLQQRRRALADR